MLGLAVGGVGGEQEPFLEAEVLLLFCVPVGEERAGGFGGILCGRVAQPAGDHEHVVVVARERHERRVALHDAAESTARNASATTRIASPATAAVSADAGTRNGAISSRGRSEPRATASQQQRRRGDSRARVASAGRALIWRQRGS